jgi:serine/threonine-protein kinase
VTTDLREHLQATLGSAYTLERELGGGGMSRVFLAEETALGRRVVVKVLAPELGAGVNAERFRREVRLAAQLQHPHVVPLLSAGERDGLLYYTMPFVAGESLRARLARAGELPLAEAHRLLRDIADALAYAHRKEVVHRDLKPDNVLLEEGHAFVTDFGVAKALSAAADSHLLTSVGVALGTPAYMAPEQAAADPATDHRADLYAFGVVAYELLAGRAPFAHRAPHAQLAAHAAEIPEPVTAHRPSVSADLATLVMRCLEKRPADRPQTADELLAVLDAARTPASGGPTTPVLPEAAAGWRRHPRRAVVTAVGAALLAAGAVVGARVALRAPTGIPARIESVAVLPFTNVGGDTAVEYFSDGMTDELGNALTRVRGLSVAARRSAYQFRGKKDVPLDEIGDALRVDAVLDGTVRRAGDRLRVTAQLTSVATGRAVWADAYERRVADVFAVQEELAAAIAAALGRAVTPRAGQPAGDTAGAPRPRLAADVEAYDLYLRGRYLWNQRGVNAGGVRGAIRLLEQAVAKGPDFAAAHAALASAYALAPYYLHTPAPEALARVRRAAGRALALDPALAEAPTALAFALASTFQWDEAEREFRRAVALDSTYAGAHHWYGYVLGRIGRTDDAVAALRRAVALEPLSFIMLEDYSNALTYAGRAEEALGVADRAVELNPTSVSARAARGLALEALGRPADATLEYERLAASGDSTRLGRLAALYMRAGQRERALALVASMERRAAAGRGSLADLAVGRFAVGDLAGGFDALHRAIERYDGGLMAQLWTLRRTPRAWRDPRMDAVLARMHLERAQFRSPDEPARPG